MKKTLIALALILGFNNSFGQKDFSPKYSNKGDKIAFYSYRNGKEPEIFVMDSNGENLKQITISDANWAIEPRWSLDDKFIGYSTGENMGQLKLAIQNLESNEVNYINQKKGLQFITSWTKYGIEYGTKDKNGFSFFRLNQNDNIIEPLEFKKFENYFLTTSSDGEYHILSVKDEGYEGLWFVDNELNYKKLTGLIGKNVSFSKDNKCVVFESIVSNNTDIYIVELVTSKIVRVTENESHDYMPSIDPKGKHIIFSSGRSGQYFIYEKDLESGFVTQLTGI
jgi:Tol biopolymer transport system component